MKKIGVIGAGAWGTSLSILANRAGNEVTIWSRNYAVVDTILNKGVNSIYLPDIYMEPSIHPTTDIAKACNDQDFILLTIPSQHTRITCISIAQHLAPNIPIVICSKGIERGSLALMSEVVGDVLPKNPVVVLSGPNFASEIAKMLPAATTIAATNEETAKAVMHALGNTTFRPYYSDDIIGAQICGAVKNVIAIACGICMARELGNNALAGLITRSLAEIRRLCLAKGGKEETLLGLSGIGDLMLTASSRLSRNTSLGYALGKGEKLDDIIARQTSVSEGITTAHSVLDLAASLDNVDMPICKVVHDILYKNLSIDKAIEQLMDRPLVSESH